MKARALPVPTGSPKNIDFRIKPEASPKTQITLNLTTLDRETTSDCFTGDSTRATRTKVP